MRGTPHQALKVHQALKPEAWGPTTGNYGESVDIRGYDELLVVLQTGVVSTSAELDVTIQTGTVTTVSAMTTTLGTFVQMTPAAGASTIILGRVNLRSSTSAARYVGCRAVGDGTNKARASVLFVLQGAGRLPETLAHTLAFDA